jgi:hypothetical protein
MWRLLVTPAVVEAAAAAAAAPVLMLPAVMMALLLVLVLRDAVSWIVMLGVGGWARIVDGASTRSHKGQPWGVRVWRARDIAAENPPSLQK